MYQSAVNDYGYGSDGSSYEEEDRQAPIEGELSPEDQLKMYTPIREDFFKRPMKVRLHMAVVGSPHEMQTNPTRAVWKIPTHLTRALKDNLAVHDRHLAREEDLVGALNRVVPLGIRVFNHQNSFPYAIGVRIPGMMDRTLTGHDQYVYVVGPHQQPPGHPVDVFDPSNIFNEWQYANTQLCSPEDLARDLVHTEKGRTKIAVNSFPHARLQERLKAREFSREELASVNISHVMDPGHDQEIEVPRAIGEAIESEIKPYVEEATRGMLDANKWHMTVHRADGHANWATPHDLVGTLVTSKTAKASKVESDLLHRVARFSIDAELMYQMA